MILKFRIISIREERRKGVKKVNADHSFSLLLLLLLKFYKSPDLNG